MIFLTAGSDSSLRSVGREDQELQAGLPYVLRLFLKETNEKGIPSPECLRKEATNKTDQIVMGYSFHQAKRSKEAVGWFS